HRGRPGGSLSRGCLRPFFARAPVNCYDIARRVPSLRVRAISSMLFGPIFQVELVTAARQRRQFLLRVFYAAIILFVLWVSYTSTTAYYRNTNQAEGVPIQTLAATATTFFIAFT